MFGKFRGQPRGVFVMFATEFWERFSYYGFMGIMVLFMVADLNAGGLGYDRSPVSYTHLTLPTICSV